MKKTMFVIMTAAVVTLMASCGKGNNAKVDLKNNSDSVSYAMGAMSSMQMGLNKEVLQMQAGIDSAHFGQFEKGLQEGLKVSEDKAKKAYFLGQMIGMQMGEQYDGTVKQFAMMKDLKLSKTTFLKGVLSALSGTPAIDMDKANKLLTDVQEKMLAENKKANQKFLEENKKKSGVVTTESGLQYKIVKAGNGPKPTEDDIVKVNYEGKNINGDVFDSTYDREQPAVMPLNRNIAGFKEALTMMPVGSTWELYIPAELAYGDNGAGRDILPGSTLIFKVELLSIEKKPEPAAPSTSAAAPNAQKK